MIELIVYNLNRRTTVDDTITDW